MKTCTLLHRSKNATPAPRTAPPNADLCPSCRFGTGTIERVDAVVKSSRRWSTVAGVLLAVAVGVVGLLVLPNVIGEGECEEGGDCPDIVTREGTEYVLMFQCDPVPAGLRRTPRDGVIMPALSGASKRDVSTYAISGIPADEVIAVEGPSDVVCPTGPVPGAGVAFSSKTDAETTARRIRTIIQP
jgi:hypothetical protein